MQLMGRIEQIKRDVLARVAPGAHPITTHPITTHPPSAADTRLAINNARRGQPLSLREWDTLPQWIKNRMPIPGQVERPAILRLADERRPICQKCEQYRGDAGKTGVHCGRKGTRPCSNVVRLDGECPEGKWGSAKITKTTPPVITPPVITPPVAGTAKITPPVTGTVFCMANGEAVPGRHIRPTVGGSIFLLCGGPSLKTLDLGKLCQPGIRTMAVNNAAKLFRPDYWTHVDAADHFIRSIFLDDRIVKFSPYNLRGGRLFDSDAWQWTDIKVQDCPNVYFYRRHTGFNAETFLYGNSICWGNEGKDGGARSVMLVAIRILYELGYRRVYLLGADFNMKTDYAYAFPQDRSDKSVSNNNYTYRALNERFKAARPHFEAAGFHVFNCNPDSGLKAFPYISFYEAVNEARLPINVNAERTEGLYDRAKPKTYSLYGKLGDAIYAIAAIRKAGGGEIVWVPGKFYRPEKQYEAMRRLLEAQPYITSSRVSTSKQGVFIDDVRKTKKPPLLADWMARGVGAQPNWHEPWLTVPKMRRVSPVIFARCPRYHNDAFPWKYIIELMGDRAVFVGVEREWTDFCAAFGAVRYHATRDLLEAAEVIAAADLVVSNQTSLFAIAVGLGKRTILEVWPRRPDCNFERPGCLEIRDASEDSLLAIRRVAEETLGANAQSRTTSITEILPELSS